MEISLDFGGSTCDVVSWEGDEIVSIESFESYDSGVDLKSKLKGSKKVYVTGGKSRFFDDETFGMPLIKVSEIDAIGYGGMWLSSCNSSVLVVSMGTGTCMVVVSRNESVVSSGGDTKCEIKHIGGTGVGGGTFAGLGKELLGISDINELLEIGSRGSASGVDLSVADIVGGDIGRVSGDATASNLGRLAREVDFKKEDLAAGMINLIGQTIGASAAFAAQAEGASKVILTGKLTRAQAISDVVSNIVDGFGIEVCVPKNASYSVAIGARIAYNSPR